MTHTNSEKSLITEVRRCLGLNTATERSDRGSKGIVLKSFATGRGHLALSP